MLCSQSKTGSFEGDRISDLSVAPLIDFGALNQSAGFFVNTVSTNHTYFVKIKRKRKTETLILVELNLLMKLNFKN